MKACLLKSYGGIDALEEEEIPTPEPKEHEVQIKVAYAGVNPVDWKIADGLLKDRLPSEFPIILGWDVSGTISRVGSKVTDFKEGDEVYAYARKETIHDGTFAQFVILEAKNVAKKPKSLSLSQAAVVPLSGLTAWQSLGKLKLQANQKVLIHAGSGGVGFYAIQFAKVKKAFVITTASSHFDELKADLVINYKTENFVTVLKSKFPQGIDAVFDTVGGKTQNDSYAVLKKDGKLLSIVSPPDEKVASKYNVETLYHFVNPSSSELNEIASLIDKGVIKLPAIEEFDFNEIKKALHLLHDGKIEGKAVIRIS